MLFVLAVVLRCFCSVIVVCLDVVVFVGVAGVCILAYDGTSGICEFWFL